MVEYVGMEVVAGDLGAREPQFEHTRVALGAVAVLPTALLAAEAVACPLAGVRRLRLRDHAEGGRGLAHAGGVLELARRVADRAAGSASDILRLAIPKRQVRVEKTWLAGERPSARPARTTGSSPPSPTARRLSPWDVGSASSEGVRRTLRLVEAEQRRGRHAVGARVDVGHRHPRVGDRIAQQVLRRPDRLQRQPKHGDDDRASE